MNKNNQRQDRFELNVVLPENPFDPTESVHEWTMWRAAVNRCILNKVMPPQGQGPPKPTIKSDRGFCLLHMPLRKFIRLGAGSEKRAQQMSSVSPSHNLTINQFVYFGIPRPKVRSNNPKGFQRFPIDKFAGRYN